MKTQYKARVVECRDCGTPIVYAGRGRPPERCPQCYTKHLRQKDRERYRLSKEARAH